MIFDLGDINKFIPYGNKGLYNCLELCKSILDIYGIKKCYAHNNILKLLYEENNTLKYYGDNPRENYKNTIKCIDKHLENGKPIIVGVNHHFNKGINEGTTDHFVVIYGKGYDDELNCYYYPYYEVGRSSADNGYNEKLNRFLYIDSDEPLFYNPKSNHTSKVRYDVTQVRPNDETII